MRLRHVLTLVAALGIAFAGACGTYGEAPPSAGIDAATSSDATTDASIGDGSVTDTGPAPAISCPQQGAFAKTEIERGERFTELLSARLVKDRIYLSAVEADGGGVPKMFAMVLAGNQLTTPTNDFAGVNWPEQDIHPFVFNGDKSVIFESRKGPANPNDFDLLFLMSRATVSSPFAKLQRVEGFGYTNLEEPWVVGQSTVYFALTAPGAGEEVWSAKLDIATATLSEGKLNGLRPTNATAAGHPVVTPDERTIYFSATENNQQNIWVAKRASAAAAWEKPTKLPSDTSTDVNEYPTWISDDDCELLYIRGGRLFRAKRTP